MSAPKQLQKQQKLARRRQRKQQRRAQRLQKGRGLSRSGLWGLSESAPIRVAPEGFGGIKMSEVLEDFVQPVFQDLPEGEEPLRRLFSLGVVAWNAAMVSEAARQEMIDGVLSKGLPGASEETRRGCEELLGYLIARKRAYFARYQRPILDFTLEDRGDGYFLAVISEITQP